MHSDKNIEKLLQIKILRVFTILLCRKCIRLPIFQNLRKLGTLDKIITYSYLRYITQNSHTYRLVLQQSLHKICENTSFY